jgi:uncharacterized protein (TIGR03437 family)
MKFLLYLLVCAPFAGAADFTNGMAARLIIGQKNFTEQAPGVGQALLGGVGGVAFANNTLFVADSNRVGSAPVNHRVLIYKNADRQFPEVTKALLQGPAQPRCPACVGLADVVLGQPDFITANEVITPDSNTLRLPTAVASDGIRLVVADTNNNRVLIWNSIPTTNQQPADVVVGQKDFKTNQVFRPPHAASMLGPQGVWIQGNQLFVADSQNHRVLIWNSIPTTNGKAADFVLGQPNMTQGVQVDLAKENPVATASSLTNPVSVTSDGIRLFVSDLGNNRILVWNRIPNANAAPADFALGQPDLVSSIPNNTPALCASTGVDTTRDNAKTYPALCEGTMEFPRFALSDGTRLFVADGGNDRILMWKTMPTKSGQTPDVIIGQRDGTSNRNSDPDPSAIFPSVADVNYILARSAPDTFRSPMSMAFDGTNLYVADPFARRVLVFSIADELVTPNGVRNSASLEIFAVGSVALSGTIKENDAVTITIAGTAYRYTILKNDTFATVINAVVKLINAGKGDPNVLAFGNTTTNTIVLTSRVSGDEGNSVVYSVSISDSAVIVLSAGGSALAGGQDAAKIAPGTIVSILGSFLSEDTASAPADAEQLPTELAGVQVYFDGLRAPIVMVSPNQINAQVPYEVLDATSINSWVRIVRKDGSVYTSSPVAVPIIPQNPGIYAEAGPDPRPGIVLHYSSKATGTISVDGSANAQDIASIHIGENTYNYTVQGGDTLSSIRDGLIALINSNPDERVSAFSAGVFTRIRLVAKVAGPAGNGIKISGNTNSAAQVILTATNSTLCCANVAGSRVTAANPAVPGETVVVYGTGLGLVQPDDAFRAQHTGFKYRGIELNQPNAFVSSLAGGKTANVLYSGLKVGSVGIFEVHLELNSDIPTDGATQLTIAQDVYVSNIITLPVLNPTPPDPPVVVTP